ncbi:hypothetical protein C8J57DRAFT_1237533 [Mycena rebaudengoi]|nr:hypothetical protein C8J57DRAFT_1237533 [Mycena rebaudengoi]
MSCYSRWVPQMPHSVYSAFVRTSAYQRQQSPLPTGILNTVNVTLNVCGVLKTVARLEPPTLHAKTLKVWATYKSLSHIRLTIFFSHLKARRFAGSNFKVQEDRFSRYFQLQQWPECSNRTLTRAYAENLCNFSQTHKCRVNAI